MKVLIEFELTSPIVELMPGTSFPQTSLHEALCKAIYEDDVDAGTWLMQNVTDVNLISDNAPDERSTQPKES